MNKHNYIKERAARNLSNRADGVDETIILENADPNVAAGLDKTFGFSVTNSADANIAMALVPANFDTERYVISDGAVVKTYDNITALNQAGYNVGAVLADGTTNATINGKTVNVVNAPTDPTKTIKQFLDFIKFNPQQLKHMDIISSNTNMWTGTISITFCNPFFKNSVQEVQLNTFFSRFQYQANRLGIDFSKNPLEFSDLLLMTCTIPGGASVQFILTFN